MSEEYIREEDIKKIKSYTISESGVIENIVYED
jgi:hypothetical protein